MKAPIKRKMRAEIARGLPLIRGDLIRQGFRGNTLSEMAARGTIFRVAHGIYVPAGGGASEYLDYEAAAAAVPFGVFTLRSALRLHGLTDENPLRMTMAIPSNRHAPRTSLPLDFVYAEPGRLDSDTETRNPDGVPFRVFTLERTLVECFRARNKIGAGVAAAALREAADAGRIDFARLFRCMEEGRMVRVMAPYVEALA